jgi:nitrous oxidase accessory protein NosD
MKKILERTGLILILLSTIGMNPINQVTLYAGDVTSAVDIEQAIQVATGYGVHPGTVILDARDGDFYFSGADKSINIFYPNLTIRSNNGAVISNCADGIFFDDLPADNIKIIGITFQCYGGGISAWGGESNHRQVIVKNNTFNVGGFGIELAYVSDWIIQNNIIETESDPISLISAQRIKVINNQLKGFSAIRVSDPNNIASDESMIINNLIEAEWVGITLQAGADSNMVIQNSIMGVQLAGILFEPNTDDNRVITNQVTCDCEYACEIVIASPEAYENNIIRANIFMK